MIDLLLWLWFYVWRVSFRMAATVAAVLRLRRMVVTMATIMIRAMMTMAMYSQGVVFGLIIDCWGIFMVMLCLP